MQTEEAESCFRMQCIADVFAELPDSLDREDIVQVVQEASAIVPVDRQQADCSAEFEAAFAELPEQGRIQRAAATRSKLPEKIDNWVKSWNSHLALRTGDQIVLNLVLDMI